MEVKYGEMDGYSAEARAGELLLGGGHPAGAALRSDE
ncbi:ABC transporter ATP-binding protein [Salmonella enterica subsp. enterica serovar Heidelberg str. 607309-5]|nr:ABC transporter ATP-binding protein [Salmonella enterica subsp. enterica serovar Heidelberg str. 607309-5]